MIKKRREDRRWKDMNSGSLIVQGGKKSLFMAIIDEIYTFDLMEIHAKKIEFRGQNIFFFLHFILLIKTFHRT